MRKTLIPALTATLIAGSATAGDPTQVGTEDERVADPFVPVAAGSSMGAGATTAIVAAAAALALGAAISSSSGTD